MELLVVVVVLGGVLGLVVYQVQEHARKERIAELQRVAAGIGFQFATEDPFATGGLPFELFGLGDRRTLRNVMWGRSPRGLAVRVCDCTIEVRTSGNKRVATRYSVAIAEIGTAWPHLVVTPEGPLAGLRDAVGMHDIQFESGEFNRALKVRCIDPRFATALCDPRMMHHLLRSLGDGRFEVSGSHLLLAVSEIPPTRFPELILGVDGLHAFIPAALSDLYPNVWHGDQP